MHRRKFLHYTAGGLAAYSLSSCGFPQAKQKTDKPNVIIIFTDDQGYGDVSSYGSETINTPHIDAMAKEGMTFTDFYVCASICTPSRAGLLTGCYPVRLGFPYKYRVFFPNVADGLSEKEITIADMLKSKGYTTKCVGKWHLGHEKEYLPLSQGFDSFLGVPYSNDMAPHLLMKDNSVIKNPYNQEELTGLYTREALKFIHDNKDNPFFLYLAHNQPHRPHAASEKWKGSSKHGTYGDAIQEIDWGIGEINKTLKKLGIDNNTIVIFTSDNGSRFGSNKPLRGGKNTSWEGGFRVPCVIKWPKAIQPGSVCDMMTSSLDVFPTLAHIVGYTKPENRITDGKNVLALWQRKPDPRSKDEAFLYYNDSHGTLDAIRMGDWKYFLPGAYKTYPPALYNLKRDIGETNDVSRENPVIVSRLKKRAIQMAGEIMVNRRNSLIYKKKDSEIFKNNPIP